MRGNDEIWLPMRNRQQSSHVWLLLVWSCLLSSLVSAQSTSGPKDASFPHLTRPEMEQFLLKAKIVKKADLSMGITNSSRAILDDGQKRHDAHIQTVDISKRIFETAQGAEVNFRDCYRYNVAAYELDKLLDLNMIPVSVERKVGSMAAVTWWVDDAVMTELGRKKKKLEPPDLDSWNRQMYVCRVFDQLIYNTDRNLGNLVITKDWKIWMIDHTRAFRMMKDLRGPANLVRCDRRLLTNMRQLNLETVNEALGRYLNSAEIAGLLARRDKIVGFFDEQIAQKGETAVLFDLARK
jgi:hypothetical protein